MKLRRETASLINGPITAILSTYWLFEVQDDNPIVRLWWRVWDKTPVCATIQLIKHDYITLEQMHEIVMLFFSHGRLPTISLLSYPATKILMACWPWISHEEHGAPTRRTWDSIEQLIHASCYNCLRLVSCACLLVYIFLLSVNYSWMFFFWCTPATAAAGFNMKEGETHCVSGMRHINRTSEERRVQLSLGKNRKNCRVDKFSTLLLRV